LIPKSLPPSTISSFFSDCCQILKFSDFTFLFFDIDETFNFLNLQFNGNAGGDKVMIAVRGQRYKYF
jgi:hypothetical protein